MLSNKAIGFAPILWQLLPTHIEMLVIGWLVQLTFGVAYWILPRWQSGRRRSSLAVSAYFLLNVGILVNGCAHWFNGMSSINLIGRATELMAVLAFTLHAWPRVKPPGAH